MKCPQCGKEMSLRFTGLYVELWWCECGEYFEKKIGG